MEFGDEGFVNPSVPGVVPELKPLITELLFEYGNTLKDSITVDDVILVLASVVGVGMAFFLGWLGVRKATRIFTTAVSTGKIKI